MTPPAPISRRERASKSALSREALVATAVALVRSEGLARVTMRRLAAEHDTGPASLYVYFLNTAALHAAVLDEILADVDLMPVTSRGPWRARMATVIGSYVSVLWAHPELARSAQVTRPSGPHYFALLEGIATLLKAGRVPAAQSAWGVDILLLWATSTAVEHSTRARAMDAEEEEQAVRDTWLAVSPDTYPALKAFTEEQMFGGAFGRFDWGLDVVLNGIAATPIPHPAKRGSFGTEDPR